MESERRPPARPAVGEEASTSAAVRPPTVHERLVPGLAAGTAPLTLLIAPAGYGKTTVLSQTAAAFSAPERGPVPGGRLLLYWHPSRDTRGAPVLLGLLARRLGLPEPTTVESLLLAVERRPERPVLLLVDDVHLVHGSPAEAVLAELALLAPPQLRLVLAGRRMPALNLNRAELAQTRVLAAPELRLDGAEIAEVFPDAPAELGRLTDGWPGVLRLAGPAVLAGRDPLDVAALRTYLDREVLAGLPERLVRQLARPGPPSPELVEDCAEFGLAADVPLLRGHLRRAGPAAPPAPVPSAAPAAAVAGPPPVAAPLSLRCFRRYEATVAGRPLDWSRTRPRVRALARLLSVHAGRPVHREELMAALWPESPPHSAGRGLQVAVSALRTFLEPGLDRGRAQVLVRSGEAYMLVLAAGGSCDVQRFEAAAEEGQRAAAQGDAVRAVAALERALRLYTGELLPEDGPAEWVVPIRERYRTQAVQAAHTLAVVELSRGQAESAVTAASHALSLDPFQDAVWRLLIAAHRRAGDPVAARHAERRHARMLDTLGVLHDT
ncbi:winged helix-turn-helix domain-containing protein [Streptomyces bambusae]|uniref:BTAD domain-containing putative transcriptional regulator n=1 Tax=Streptomyces bambusae TaxID=1550616 RepID=UPI001CFDC9B2|nr:BTAD domain-containing putative transcriptional regulator [Streptomyces bambusae]MCB5168501.1 winged helix-turn-helix domain-containing protein [Streptomyces bambusae]